jgi:hypothetical protein
MHACLIGRLTKFAARHSQVTHMVLPAGHVLPALFSSHGATHALFASRRCRAACCAPVSGLVLRSSQRQRSVGTLPLSWPAYPCLTPCHCCRSAAAARRRHSAVTSAPLCAAIASACCSTPRCRARMRPRRAIGPCAAAPRSR